MWEPKWDGYRMIVFRGGGRVILQSRNDTDLTTAFPEIVAAAAALTEEVVLDGEAVIYQDGRLAYSALGHRLGRRTPGCRAPRALRRLRAPARRATAPAPHAPRTLL